MQPAGNAQKRVLGVKSDAPRPRSFSDCKYNTSYYCVCLTWALPEFNWGNERTDTKSSARYDVMIFILQLNDVKSTICQTFTCPHLFGFTILLLNKTSNTFSQDPTAYLRPLL